MAITKMRYAGNTAATSTNTHRMPSEGLWHDCPWEAIRAGNADGTAIWYDFVDDLEYNVTEGWTTTQYDSTGTVNILSEQHGILELDSAAADADDGIQTQMPIVQTTPVANRTVWFEARIKISDTPATSQLFVGLSEIDPSILAAGVNTSTNHVGFEMSAATVASDPGECFFYGEKAGARTGSGSLFTFSDAATTTDNTEWKKIGFRLDGVTRGLVYVDGVYKGVYLPTANIPIVALSPSFCIASESTTDPILEVDWFRLATWEGLVGAPSPIGSVAT